MARVFTKDEYRAVKSMQKSGWKLDTIIRRSGWSRRTVERAMDSESWSGYRLRVHNATKSINLKRREKADAAYIDPPVNVTHKLGLMPPPKHKNFFRRALHWLLDI